MHDHCLHGRSHRRHSRTELAGRLRSSGADDTGPHPQAGIDAAQPRPDVKWVVARQLMTENTADAILLAAHHGKIKDAGPDAGSVCINGEAPHYRGGENLL